MRRLIGALLIFGFCSLIAIAQEPILSFSTDPSEVHLPAGGMASLVVEITNKSAHTADDITVTPSVPDGLAITPAEGKIKEIRPFGKGSVEFTLSAVSELAPLTYNLTLSILYTYCIEVSCFQIADEVTVPVTVTTASAGPVHREKVSRSLSPWVIPAVGVVLLGIGIALWTMGFRIPLYLVLFLFVIGGFVYGVRLGQHEQAQGIAAVLCTSCVGIEESRAEAPRLSNEAIRALSKLDRKVTLVVFYAPWCHSCPYAEEMVKEMAEANPLISYKFVNVDTNRSLASSHGIIRNRRTVVPAVLNVDTGEVIFGIDNLEARLLKMLGVGG